MVNKKEKVLTLCFIGFVILNALFYTWISLFHTLVPFSSFAYTNDANHYIDDPRNTGGPFSLPNALAQYDSQWYLKIADKGYPYQPDRVIMENPKVMEGLMYNFFPFYPLLIAALNLFSQNVVMSAFILSLLLLVGIFFSLYYVVSELFTRNIACKTLFLFFLYPFSIYLHGYYSEAVRLLLFIWICYAVVKKYWVVSAILVGLLCITSGISLLLLLFFWGLLFWHFSKKKISLQKLILASGIAFGPFGLWMLFTYFQTGDPIFFFKTRYAWDRPDTFPLLHNLGLLFQFPWLPLKSFYGSQIDVLVMFLMIVVAFVSRTVLPKVIWLMTCLLAFTPLLLQDTVSLGRFSIVLFPFFVYLATILNKKMYGVTVTVFAIGLLAISVYFINWYWVE